MPDLIVSHSNPDVPLQRAFPGPQGILHPENIELPAGVEHPAFGVARDALTYAFDNVEAVDVFRGNQSDEDRSATHDRKVRERVDQTQDAFAEKMTRADNDMRRALADVEAQLVTKAGLKPNAAHFDAITSAFYQMKPGQRAETIAGLIEQGENAALATLMEAPLFLTGLTAEQRDTIKERVFAKVDPQGVKLRDALTKGLAKLDMVGNASVGIFNALRADTHIGAAKERAAKVAARTLAANTGR